MTGVQTCALPIWYISISFLGLIFQFLGPTVVIVTCNLLIARAVRSSPDVQGRREVWLVHVYSLVFVVCWLPFHVVNFLMMIDDLQPLLLSCNAVEVLYFSFSVVQCLSLFHCVANPIIHKHPQTSSNRSEEHSLNSSH